MHTEETPEMESIPCETTGRSAHHFTKTVSTTDVPKVPQHRTPEQLSPTNTPKLVAILDAMGIRALKRKFHLIRMDTWGGVEFLLITIRSESFFIANTTQSL